MKFGSPEFFKWLLLLLPLIIVLVVMHRQRSARLSHLIASTVWKTVMPGHNQKRVKKRTVLRLLALLFIGLALTRPQWGVQWREVHQRGLDIAVVLDTSKSMLAADIKPNRLQQAKWAVRDFVRHLKGDRIGLIAFSGSSFLQCPITVDYAAFTMMLNDLYAGIIPRGGTAIGQALETAADSFDSESEADRVIILITDGEDHEGDPMQMAEKLKDKNIRLYSIGVGTAAGELIPAADGRGYLKDEQGRVVKSALNETLLEKLASTTGGFYVRSAPGDFGLDRIYKLGIANLQRDEQETRLAKVYEERFGWFAGAALLFLIMEGLLRAPKVILLLPLLLLCTPNAEAKEWPDIDNYNQARELYADKKFLEASERFAEASKQTENNKLKQQALYNQGTALLAASTIAQTNDTLPSISVAIDLLEHALELAPTDADTKMNLERAINLGITGHTARAGQLIDAADQMLSEFQAASAKTNYLAALEMLDPVFKELDPVNQKASELKDRADGQLQMLDRAIAATKDEMANAKHAIDMYEYKTAADVFIDDKPERKWAFDLDKKLAQEFQQLIQNNQNVIQIIYPDNPLNTHAPMIMNNGK